MTTSAAQSKKEDEGLSHSMEGGFAPVLVSSREYLEKRKQASSRKVRKGLGEHEGFKAPRYANSKYKQVVLR